MAKIKRSFIISRNAEYNVCRRVDHKYEPDELAKKIRKSVFAICGKYNGRIWRIDEVVDKDSAFEACSVTTIFPDDSSAHQATAAMREMCASFCVLNQSK